MKTTAGYFLALIFGLLVGWVAQQFWLSQSDPDPLLSSPHSISRQQQRLLNLQAHAKAVDAQHSSEVSSMTAETEFLNAIHQEQFDRALDIFTQLGTSTLEELVRLSELAYKQGRYEALFSNLYEFRYGLDYDIENKLFSNIALFVEKVDDALGAQQKYDALVEIYRLLISLDAGNTAYYLRLSYWQLQAGKPLDASQSLVGARNDIQLEKEVTKLQAAIDVYEEHGAHIDIPLIAAGEHYLVPLVVGNGKVLSLMLDTGASKTVIKRDVLEQHISLSQLETSNVLMNTANGQTAGYRVSLSNVSLNTLNFQTLEVVLMDLPQFAYDGLLGMNVLGQFEFNIDQENLILKLLPKKPSLTVQTDPY